MLFLVRLGCVASVAIRAAGVAQAADWPQWRGPERSGVWMDVELPTKFDERTLKRRWRAEVGGGYSGIAVNHGRVFTLDCPAKGTERVIALATSSGKRLWTHEYDVSYGDLDYGSGPRATPTIDRGLVFALGAVGHVSCLDERSGSVLWTVDGAAALAAKMPTWGQASSPLVWKDLVFLQIGARPGGTVVALERESGRERWRALEDRPGYSSPILVDAGGKEELVVWTADRVVGLAPTTGALLWSHDFKTSNYDVAIISPVPVEGRLFVSGYWDGSSMIELDEKRAPRRLWSQRLPSCLMSTPLVRGPHLYALDRRSGLVALAWTTGKVLWEDHALTPKGRNPHASLVWAGDRLVALNSEGELVLAEVSAQGYREHGRVRIVEATWAHPAFAGQQIYARSDTELVCWTVRAPSPPTDP